MVGSKKKPRPLAALPPVVTSMCRSAAARDTMPATRSRCAAEIKGPISTPGLSWVPTLMELAAWVRSATTRSYTFLPTYRRQAAVQSCPAL